MYLWKEGKGGAGIMQQDYVCMCVWEEGVLRSARVTTIKQEQF